MLANVHEESKDIMNAIVLDTTCHEPGNQPRNVLLKTFHQDHIIIQQI